MKKDLRAGRMEVESDLWEVESSTHSGETYIVDLREGSCTCPGFRFRGYCKHLTGLKEEKNFKPSEI